MEERIQKIISAAGVVSRRAAEELISEGRVRVNGTVVTELGTKADPDKDHIKVDGKLINPQQPKTYVMLNKPMGFVTTMFDPEGRPVVANLLKGVRVRVYPVGRLDYNTEGLLLLTNDGDFAHLVTHPKHELPKTYLVKVKGVLSDSDVENLEKGVFLKDGKTAPAKVRRIRKEEVNSYVEITIHEGRKRQVRRMIDHTGHSVIKLKRTKVGTLTLGDLELGAYRHLTSDEVWALKEASLREPGAVIKPQTLDARKEKVEEKLQKKVIRKKKSDDIEFIEPLTSRKPRKSSADAWSPSSERLVRRETRGPRPEGKPPWQGTDRPARPSFRGKPEGASGSFRPRTAERGERQSERPVRRDTRGPRPESKRPWQGSERPAQPSFRGRPEGGTGGFRPRSSDREGGGFDRPARPSFRGKPEGASGGFRSEGRRPSFRSRPESSAGGFRPRTDRGERPSFRGRPEGGTGGFRPRSSDREGRGFDRPARPSFRGKPEDASKGFRSEGRRPSFSGRPESGTGGFRPRTDRGERQGERPVRRETRGPRAEGTRPWQGEKRASGPAFKPRERTSGFGPGPGRPRASGPRPSRPRAGKPGAGRGRRD